MRAMTPPDAAEGPDLRRATRAGALATCVFLAFAWLTTQVESLRSSLPFTEDPYDAVVSFAVVGIAVVGGATVLRAVGQARRPTDRAAARRIAIGAALATAMAGIALASDLVALLAVGVDPAAPWVAASLLLLAVSMALTLFAAVAVWRARGTLRRVPPWSASEPDMLDEVGSILGALGARQSARRLVAWLEGSPLSPRRHRVAVGVIAGLAAGIAAVGWHAIREGAWASPAAAGSFGLLMAVGVTGAYLICLAPLRLIRSAAPERPTGTG
jgi:hypothetical protein